MTWRQRCKRYKKCSKKIFNLLEHCARHTAERVARKIENGVDIDTSEIDNMGNGFDFQNLEDHVVELIELFSAKIISGLIFSTN